MNHNENEDGFEQRIAEGLKRLADGAPEGPGSEDVLQALRRRKQRRTAVIGAGILVLAAAACIALVFSGFIPGNGEILSDDSRLDDKGSTTGKSKAQAPSTHVAVDREEDSPSVVPAPIPADADRKEVESILGEYLASMEVSSGFFEKEPDGEVAFSFVSNRPPPPDRVSREMSVLLRNFDRASVRIHRRELSFSLIVH